MSNVKPCPFCGELPDVEYFDDIKKYWVTCNNPKCRIQPHTDAHASKAVVVREWNRRKEDK